MDLAQEGCQGCQDCQDRSQQGGAPGTLDDKPATLAKPSRNCSARPRKPEKTCKDPPRKSLDEISKAMMDALAIANKRKAPAIAPRSCLAWTFNFSLLAC